MARNDLGELRRAALVSTFGPGSVVDFRGSGGAVSGVLAGLETWDEAFPPAGLAHSQTVTERRLQKKLQVGGFRLPPVPESSSSRNAIFAVPEMLGARSVSATSSYSGKSSNPQPSRR